MSTAVENLCFYYTSITPDSELFTVIYAFNLETLIYWDVNFANKINFQSLEVVYCGSETQLQVNENLRLKECYCL